MKSEAELCLSVIIISYNTREITLRCLRTLFGELQSTRDLTAEVWVVDNASSDGSVEAIREEFPMTRIIANQHNRGFGAANNQAMKQARGEYFLLLNSDAFIAPGSLTTLIEYLESCPDVAVVGPKLLNADGTLQPSCWNFPSPARVWLENLGIVPVQKYLYPQSDFHTWAHDEERLVDFVSGACLLVHRTDYEASGGFDESFLLYGEETDWQKRLSDAGRKIAFIPQAQVTHLGGASGHASTRTRRHFFEGLDRYVYKHHGLAGVLSVRLATVIGNAARTILWLGAPLIPSRRTVAKEKISLHFWLLLRQANLWTLPRIKK